MINSRSSEPPSDEQLVAYRQELDLEYRCVAAGRGYESCNFIIIGYLTSTPQDHPYIENGPPERTDTGLLLPSGWKRGSLVLATDHRDPWSVKQNHILHVWGDRLFANIVMLLRPFGGKQPATPSTNLTREPCALVGADISTTLAFTDDEEALVRQLLCCCIDWGDWSPIPESEFTYNLDDEQSFSCMNALRHLEARRIIRLEERPAQERLIHILPSFVDIFVDVAKTMS